MPNRIVWTAAQDAQIKRLRAEGATWDAIGAALGISRFTAIDRGRRIGAPPATAADPTPPVHALTWLPLIAGSCIAGNAYTPPTPDR